MKSTPLIARIGALAVASLSLQSCSTREFGDGNTGAEVQAYVPGVGPCSAPDVVVYGQTTAALAAALGAAAAGKDTDAIRRGAIAAVDANSPNVCFIEPTDWPGGQLTSEGVSAIDFPWHAFQEEMRSRHNINKTFASFIAFNASNIVSGVSPGACSVSAYCTPPRALLAKIEAELKRYPNIQVIRNAVVKRVTTAPSAEGKRIVSIDVFRRYPKPGKAGQEWSVPLSRQFADWYGADVSGIFGTELVKLNLPTTGGKMPMVIDASETGDILVLSGASYVQGAEASANSYGTNLENHGQAFVFPFVHTTGAGSNPNPTTTAASKGFYNFNSNGKVYSGDYIFKYRQISATTTLQNWNPGNDYAFDYLFLSRANTNAQKGTWQGGIDIKALERAETHALGWHQYYRQIYLQTSGKAVNIDTAALGTANGLAKFPYMRDIRRSVGINGTFIRNEDIWAQPGSNKGKQWDDSIATGLYAADFHSMKNAPAYLNVNSDKIAPFTLPFVAHTNKDFENLLVAGKSISQTYYVNAATRLQPIEFNSGWGAGAAAEHMWRWGITSYKTVRNEGGARTAIQTKVAVNQPIWMCRSKGFDKVNCVSGEVGNFKFGTVKPGP